MNHDLKRLEAVAHSHIPEILLLSSLRLERVEDAGGGEQHSESHIWALHCSARLPKCKVDCKREVNTW